jgi:hypothetical protein
MLQDFHSARLALATLRPGDAGRRAGCAVRFGLVSGREDSYGAMEALLSSPSLAAPASEALGRSVWRADDPECPPDVDIVLYAEDLHCPTEAFVFDASDPSKTVREILDAHAEWDLALARAYPAFRAQVAERIIRAAANENALFAVVTASPDAIPGLAEIPSTLGEFSSATLFITVSQLRMAFQLAAAYGRPVGYLEQKRELAAIAAGAFGWRALARKLAIRIPFGGGMAPKGAIAFAGTYAAGWALVRLYQRNS